MPNYRTYQYETSPRKILPEYETKTRKRYPNTNKKRANVEKLKKQKIEIERKERAKQKRKIIIKYASTFLYVSIIFGVILAIGYRNSLIDEKFSEIKSLKDELASIEKENEQLEVTVETTLNLKNIEQSAKELLGMQSLSNKQTVYVNLPKKDYVEAATEEVKKTDSDNFVKKIINLFNQI